MNLTNIKVGGWNVLGAMARAAMFSADNYALVDGDLGSASNPGTDTDTPVNSITNALTKVGRSGVVYVKPKQTAASAQSYYTDNFTLPLTKPGLKIIGCGADEDSPYGGGPEIKMAVASSPVVTVNGQGMVLEGLRLAGTGLDATVSIIDAQDNTSTRVTTGLVVRGCRLGNGRGHGAAAAAIFLNSSWFNKIIHNVFTDCLTAIAVFTNSGGITNGLKVIDNDFDGQAANRDCDIYVSGGSTSNGLLLHMNRHNDALPAHADGTIKRFIKIENAITGMLSDSRFAFTGATIDSLIGTAGTQAIVPATVFIVHCFAEGSAEGIGIASR